ncbi:AIG2-like protein [Acorus calamus]|uniref:Putative gamma-glutamylcyclotransferase n=1 Tax=Acorus calamus TaxID=4465 RepID=A0AAV9EPJ8_ACOCL|nr:AIG2-like protein [Acorus calamus]
MSDGLLSSSSSSSSSALAQHNVFVYGSLLADEVVHVLLKRVPPSSPATLYGFHRFSIKGRIYPAILPVENKKVDGKVLLGITDPELDVLDTFEDVEYVRRPINVSLAVTACMDGPEKLHAYTYVWENKRDPDLYGDWDFEDWKKLHLKDFLEMTEGLMEELEQPESKLRVAINESFFQQGDSQVS